MLPHPLSRLAALTFLTLPVSTLSVRAEEAPAEEKTSSLGKQYQSIVNVECSSLRVDYRTPWNAATPTGGSGTAFLIGPNLFMTNAHVVSNASRLEIKRVGDSTPHRARVKHIAHDCDLALLELDPPVAAFEKAEPLAISVDIPKLDTTVKVVGFPIGGDRISVTRGVVSRVDYQEYSHSGVDQHLAIQIDAAINPGNSGGPVLQDGKVIGVAFQGYSGDVAQNTGYMIPVPVIRRFLKDVEDGKYDHYGELAIAHYPILNPAQRKVLNLPAQDVGVMITSVDSTGTCAGVLKPGDVLLALDGYAVDSNGSINIDGEQTEMAEVVERKFVGDKIKLKVWRDGKEQEFEVALKAFPQYLIQANQYERQPEYVMYAGLVFQPLDRELMDTFGLTNLRTRYYFNYYTQDELYKEMPEVVVLTSILPDSINTWLRDYTGQVVEEVNGVKVKSLKDVQSALAHGPEGSHVVIKLAGESRPLALDKTLVSAAHARIRQKYRVSKDAYITP
ncbi:MAG: 2-alkenal reductase [Verrucomicrobiales bacterium]|nr:2-alkenal reductase [Verrucomicrobiales bacterium]